MYVYFIMKNQQLYIDFKHRVPERDSEENMMERRIPDVMEEYT